MKRTLGIIVIVIASLVSLWWIFYTLFFSPNSANHEAVMTLRYYYAPLLQRLPLPSPAIRAARRDAVEPDYYWYTLRGKIEQVSPDHLVIRASDGQPYRFNMYWREPDPKSVQHIGLEGSQLSNNQNDWLWLTFDLTKPLNDPNEYAVVWRDKRPLADILTAYHNIPDQPLNTIERLVKYLIRHDIPS
jgi:hypothetical protein